VQADHVWRTVFFLQPALLCQQQSQLILLNEVSTISNYLILLNIDDQFQRSQLMLLFYAGMIQVTMVPMNIDHQSPFED